MNIDIRKDTRLGLQGTCNCVGSLFTGLPLVREKSGKFKVREKSDSLEKSQGNLKFSKKSGKFMVGQGNFNISDENFTH